MLFEVDKKQFEAAIKKVKPEAIILASYTVNAERTVQRSKSEPPEGSPPGTAAQTIVFNEKVPEHVGAILVLTAGGEMIFRMTEAFEPSFVLEVLPMATVVGSIHG